MSTVHECMGHTVEGLTYFSFWFTCPPMPSLYGHPASSRAPWRIISFYWQSFARDAVYHCQFHFQLPASALLNQKKKQQLLLTPRRSHSRLDWFGIAQAHAGFQYPDPSH
jgi:hypothetical protein